MKPTVCFPSLLALLASIPAIAGEYVADPFRSVDVTWPKHEIKGRDYWLMLDPEFLNLKGLENEPFVKDSGTARVPMKCDVRRANPWGFSGPDDFYAIGDVIGDAAFKERLKRAPFEVWPSLEMASGLKQTEKNFDYTGYENLVRDYGETFLGVRFNEWDSGVLHSLHRYTAPTYEKFREIMKFPCNRAEMRENFHAYFKSAQVRNGPRVTALSGLANFEHWACEWGSTISCLETASEDVEYALRNSFMFARGAARQFNVPLCFYTPYYRGPYAPDSRPDRHGPEAGQETSLTWREHLLAYYMGGNLQNIESQPWGQVRKLADGNHELTANGLEFRRLYEWTRSEKGVRGECYTPILFLLDRAHGFDQLSHTSIEEDFGAYKGSYPPSDADFYTEYAMRAIHPRYNILRGQTAPDNSAGLRNSPLGDIFDVYIANSDVHGKELRDDQLAKYAVVMALGDIVWSNQLVNRIRKYVYEGGTLVITAGQAAPFAEELRSARASRAQDCGTGCAREVTSTTDAGISLAPFGRGRFVYIANPFMRQEKERWKVPQAMKDLLAKLQDEVVPFKVTGDCEFLYNRMPDGSWKAIVMNNAGTAKKGNEPNPPPDPKWTRTVTLELPADAEVEEVLEGLEGKAKVEGEGEQRRKLVSFDVLSGQVIVVNVKSSQLQAPSSQLQAESSKLQAPSSKLKPSTYPDQVYKPHPVWDKYLKNPEEHRYTQTAPGTIFDWTNPTGGKEAATTNVEIKAQYYLPTCTFDIEAKASLDPAKAPKGRHEGTLFFASELLGAGMDRDNRWYCYIYSRVNARICGPKATGDWQKVRVTFDRGFVRFFVDGKEYVDEKRGPLKVGTKDCRDRFYERINIDVGEAHHGWGNYFPGVIRTFRATSEPVPDEESPAK